MDRHRRRIRILAWSVAASVLVLLVACVSLGTFVTAGKRSVWVGMGKNYVSVAPRGGFLPPTIDSNTLVIGPALEGRGCGGNPSAVAVGGIAVGYWECRR